MMYLDYTKKRSEFFIPWVGKGREVSHGLCKLKSMTELKQYGRVAQVIKYSLHMLRVMGSNLFITSN